MHIVFVSQIIPYPPHGGVLQRGFNLLRELGKNHQVDLLAYIHSDTLRSKEDIEKSKEILSKFCRNIEFFSLWPKRSLIHKYTAFLASVFYPLPFSVMAHMSANLARQLKEMLLNDKPDLVHLDTIALAPLRRICGNIPTVLTHHNIESQLMRRRANMESSILKRMFVKRQSMILSAYEKRHTPCFPLNIMVSEPDARHLELSAPGVCAAVVENGVDIDYFKPRIGDEQRAVIYTGGMNMFANRDAVCWFLNDIWPTLKRSFPDIIFFAVGQDPPKEILKLKSKDSGINVTGYVDDIRPWVAKAAVYVVPLRVGGGTRLKVVDAMAQGKAIVSTSLGCEGIRVKNGSNILIADTPEDFAQRVILLLQDKERRESLGGAARKLAEQEYAWPIIGKKLVNAYKLAIERHMGAPRDE